MSSPASFSESVRHVFGPTPCGVDGLLRLSQERELRLDWHADQCRVRTISGQREESFELPLPNSVFRAVLARLAVLCNERNLGPVSPYGREGELTVGADPAT